MRLLQIRNSLFSKWWLFLNDYCKISFIWVINKIIILGSMQQGFCWLHLFCCWVEISHSYMHASKQYNFLFIIFFLHTYHGEKQRGRPMYGMPFLVLLKQFVYLLEALTTSFVFLFMIFPLTWTIKTIFLIFLCSSKYKVQSAVYKYSSTIL